MNNSFSHLVWLGAGSASEPENVIASANRATLFEAREAACLNLTKQYCKPEINVVQMLLTEHGAKVEFTEYNLAEYSAIKSVSGLKKLFPGLKKINTEQQVSTSVAEAVGNLKLRDNNNLLIVDIADSSLTLLQTLGQNQLLTYFREVRVQSSDTPLYEGAASSTEVINFLEQQGFVLQQINNTDPDLPWLCFRLDSLWRQLKEANDSQHILNTNLEQIKQELGAANQKLIEKNDEIAKLKIQLDEYVNLNQKSKELTDTLQKEVATLKQQLEQQVTANTHTENQPQSLEKMAEELSRVTKERDEQAGLYKKHKDWAESLRRDIEAMKADYAEGERAQSLALKLQAKAQADLDHLRDQYQQKLQQEQNLIELIQELQLKLQAAANYYHQLQLQYPELSTDSKHSNSNNTIEAEIVTGSIKPMSTQDERK